MAKWFRKIYNPNKIEEFTIAGKYGDIKLQKVTKRRSFEAFRESSLWKTAGPMLTFVGFAGVLCYYVQSERLKSGDIYKSNEYINSVKHQEINVDEMLLEYQKRIVDPTLGIRPMGSSSALNQKYDPDQ